MPVGCRASSVGSMATNVSRDLLGMGAWPPGVLEACGPCLSQRRNVLVTGITGAGMTTLLQAMARRLPSNEPVLVLDDCEELDLDGPLREFLPLWRGGPAQSPREAMARALRVSPRRLVFANVCPPEAGEVLRALGDGRHHGQDARGPEPQGSVRDGAVAGAIGPGEVASAERAKAAGAGDRRSTIQERTSRSSTRRLNPASPTFGHISAIGSRVPCPRRIRCGPAQYRCAPPGSACWTGGSSPAECRHRTPGCCARSHSLRRVQGLDPERFAGTC